MTARAPLIRSGTNENIFVFGGFYYKIGLALALLLDDGCETDVPTIRNRRQA